jgi:hypothetical protein
MQLIDGGFTGWYKKYSVIALVLIGALSAAWAASPEFQSVLGERGLVIANGVLAVLGFLGRFIKQTQAALPD